MDRSKWEYKKLSMVSMIRMGQSPSSDSYNEEGKGLPFYQGNADFGVLHPQVRVYCDAPQREAYENDILMSVRAPIGSINIANTHCCIGRGLCAISPMEGKLDLMYLYYFLISQNGYLNQQGTGSTFKSISKKIIFELSIPVPSVEDQQVISGEISCLNEMIAVKQEQLKEFDKLAQSIFYDMFGDIYCTTFDIKTLNEVCEFIKDGTHQTPTYTEDKENGVKFLSAKDVVGGYINWANIKHIPYELHMELHKRVAPKRNDLLLCKNGTTGICAIVDKDETFDIYVSLALLRPHAPSCPIYLLYAINNPLTKKQFDESLKGVGVPNLHLGEIKKARIIYPPLALQQQFAEKIQAIEAQKELVKKSIAETQALLDYTMDKYFG